MEKPVKTIKVEDGKVWVSPLEKPDFEKYVVHINYAKDVEAYNASFIEVGNLSCLIDPITGETLWRDEEYESKEVDKNEKPEWTAFLQKYLIWALKPSEVYRSNWEIANYFWENYILPLQEQNRNLTEEVQQWKNKARAYRKEGDEIIEQRDARIKQLEEDYRKLINEAFF